MFVACPSPDLANDDEAGVDPDAHLQRRSERTSCGWLTLSMETADCLYDTQSCPHGTLGIVFMGQGIAKVDQQSIPEILRDVAIKVLDHNRAGRMIGLYHLAKRFWIKVRRERSGRHQIAKEYGQVTAFS